MKKLHLKYKSNLYCSKDGHKYEFKETTCGRYNE